MPKKKHSGHYCKICGQYKANEKFSGKGHAAHICKACSGLSAAEKTEAMTMNRLLDFPVGRLSESEIQWLKNRTHDKRPEVAELAQEIYRQRFPYAERITIKKQLVVNRLTFEIHGEVWDSYGDCITVSQCFTVCRKERTVTLRDFETEELEQAVALDGGKMAKLLKWIVHTLEIFMWPQDYGLRGTGGPFLEMSQDPFDDSDGEDWTDTMEDTGQDQDETWQARIEYSNGMVQEIYGGDEELPDRAEELYLALAEYFETEETEWE